MDRDEDIKNLFKAVFESLKKALKIEEWRIKQAVGIMGNAYQPNPHWETNKENILRYDEPSLRCAYLLKYAILHTGLVYDVLSQAYKIHRVKNTIEAKQELNLCSLGSGPGTDIVALMFFLRDNFELKRCQANLVDQSIGWKQVFESVIDNLRSIGYSDMVTQNYFSFEYLEANLLKLNDGKVAETIRNADIITMVKFMSAAACKDTNKMLKKIFQTMKFGALLLFIDNAAGGFRKMFERNAKLYGLEILFGPLKHYEYKEPKFNIETFGISSQYETKVAVEMWIKKEYFALNQANQSHIGIQIDYAIPQSGIVDLSFEKDNDGFYNSAQGFSDMTDVEQQNIRLQDDSLSNKEDGSPKCCVIM